MWTIGIDPGKTGGVALVNSQSPILKSMPLLPDRRIDGAVLRDWLCSVDLDGCICGIERAQSMPQQGIKSTFNYGVDYGIVFGILTILKIPFYEIAPATWKKYFSLWGKDKSESVAAAIKLCPDAKDQIIRPKMRGEGFVYNDGLAEALLIAIYTKTKFRN